jgi:hypothetical protein
MPIPDRNPFAVTAGIDEQTRLRRRPWIVLRLRRDRRSRGGPALTTRPEIRFAPEAGDELDTRGDD